MAIQDCSRKLTMMGRHLDVPMGGVLGLIAD